MRKYIILMLMCTIIFMPTYVKANILCNDGTESKTCVDCHSGCCSHHGGCLRNSNSSSSKNSNNNKPVFTDGSSNATNNSIVSGSNNETNTINSNINSTSSNNRVVNDIEDKNDDSNYGVLGLIALLGGIGYHQLTKSKKS